MFKAYFTPVGGRGFGICYFWPLCVYMCVCVCVSMCVLEHVLCLQVLVEQLPLQPAARLPLLGQLSLGAAVLRLLPARLLLRLVHLALQGADPLGHLEDQSQSGGLVWTHRTGQTC